MSSEPGPVLLGNSRLQADATCGPAQGRAPLCAVATVSTVYAAGPASDTARAVAPANATVRDRVAGTATIRAAAASPPTSTMAPNSGCQSALRSSSPWDHPVVEAIAALATYRANGCWRLRQRIDEPAPMRAPTGGASAIV